MGLTAKRNTDDQAEKLARATALLGRVRFPPPEVAAALALIRDARIVPVAPQPKPRDDRQVPITLLERTALEPDANVDDCPLGTDRIRACVCAARQRMNELKTGLVLGTKRRGKGGKSDTAKKRGVSREYPSCVSELCPVGRRVRAQLQDDATEVRHGARRDVVSLHEARQRQALVTVEAPTIDSNLGEE